MHTFNYNKKCINYQVRFLGDKGGVIRLSYPTQTTRHMKTRIIITAISIIIGLSRLSAQYVDLESIPKYDCKFEKERKFVSKGFIFVIPDVTDSILNERMEVYPSWYNDTVEIKKESELVKSDYSKNLWIVGKISDFNHWNLFELPIHKIDNGFVFRDERYTQRLDGICYIDTNRIVYAGNDNMCLFGIREPSYSNGMDFTLTQNLRRTIFGNYLNDRDSVIVSDLRILRKNNYRFYPTQFMDFYVSLKIDSFNIEQIEQEQKSFCQDFCTFFKLQYPKEKIKAFFHNDQLEILMISGYWDRCGGTIGGLAPKGEIHTWGISTNLISHEFGHKIFESHYGSNDDKPGYLSEGVIRYYFNCKNKNQFKKDLQVAYDKVNTIDYLSKFDEWSRFDFRDDYPISGIFIKYIVDNYGIEKLNLYYSKMEFVNVTQEIFGKPFDSFITDYKVWIKREFESAQNE